MNLNSFLAIILKRSGLSIANSWRGYSVAILSIVLATGSLFLSQSIIGTLHPFTTYILAVLFTSWYCGTGPAILAMSLGLVTAAYYFLYPIFSVQIHGIDAQVGAVLYLIVGASSIFFTESMRSANIRAQSNAEETERKHQALQLEIAKRETAQRENLILLRRFVRVQEEERRRISRELHDQCGQDVTALQLGVRFLAEAIDVHVNPKIPAHLRDLNQLLERLSREIHELALELRPPSLDDMGLRTAVESYLSIWSFRTKIPVDFECRNQESRGMSSEISTALYRVLQEALTNVAKHSQAKRVSVILEFGEHQALAIVEDQGVGFQTETKPITPDARLHLGLLGMRERLEAVGGSFEIESALGSGTTVFAKVPLHQE